MNKDHTYLFDFKFSDNTNYTESVTSAFKVEKFKLDVYKNAKRKHKAKNNLVKNRIKQIIYLKKAFKVNTNIQFDLVINHPGKLQSWDYTLLDNPVIAKANLPKLIPLKNFNNVARFKWTPSEAGNFQFKFVFDDGFTKIKRSIQIKVETESRVKLVITPAMENNSVIHFVDEGTIQLYLSAKEGKPPFQYTFGSNPYDSSMKLKDGLFSFTPDQYDMGDYHLNFSVKDSEASADDRSIKLIISDLSLSFDPPANETNGSYNLSLGETLDIKVLPDSNHITSLEYLPGTMPPGPWPWDSFNSILSVKANDLGVGTHTAHFKIYDEKRGLFRIYDLKFSVNDAQSYEAYPGVYLRKDEVTIMEPGSDPLVPKAGNNKIKWKETIQLVNANQFTKSYDSITGDYNLCNISNLAQLNLANVEEKLTKVEMKTEEVIFTRPMTKDMFGAAFMRSACRDILKRFKKYSGTYSSMLVGCHTSEENINFECSKELPK